MTCVPRTCGILKAPAAGSMKCDRTAFGGSCLFSCQPGYFVNEGGSERKCLPNGEWSGEPTVCTPLDCGAPRGESATFSCPHGTELGDSCQVHCKPGFSRPENAGTTICQQNGKWSGSLQCKPIRCQVPPTPQFGVMNCTGHTLGHQCVASCSEGFDLTGSPVRTCSENSQFSGSAAACKPVVCPIIKKPIGGSLICGSIKNGTADILGANLYGSSCSVRCNPGFVLQGSPTRNCRANGVWSGSVGLCKPTDCGEPSHIEGCKHSCPWGHSLGSKCEIQAMSGHVLKTTQPVIECLNTGAWSSGGAKCPPKKCDSAPEVSGGETACSQKSFVGSVCGLKCSPDMVRSGQVSKECKMDLSWSHGNMTCGRIPERATKLVLLGNHTPAFSLVSKVGSVSVRVEAAEKQKAYVALQSNTTASASKWLLGMLEDDNSFSICYGKVAKPNCAIEVQADGTVHFRGSVNFHDRVQHSPLINQDSQVAQVETASGQASLKQNPASASKSTQLGTAMSFQLSSEPRTEGLVQSIEDELSLLELGNGYSYTTSVSTGAKWVTHGGDIGIRIGSDNSIEGREAYAEFRSRDQLEAWGMGIRGDYGLHIGYGVAGKFKDTNSSLSVYNDKIEIKVNAVFHKKASYHQAGVVQLKLSESIPEAHKKTIELPNTLETSAIPDVPEFSNTTFFSSGSAEPLLTYSSDSETGISIEGNQQVFLELSNQVQNRWRLRVGPDQNLHMAYKGEGGNTASEKAPMILHKDGSIHFYQPVLFTGGTYRIA